MDSVRVENSAGAGRFVIVCDHAANHFPAAYKFLGLPQTARDAHVAWDPGALGVSRHLARRLDAPLVHSTVSRLVIDCNRALDAPDLICAMSESIPVPGNASISEPERRRRIAAVHEPYHAAIDALLKQRLKAGLPTSVIAVHSFTPIYRGVSRPWQVGIIFDRDRRLADILVGGLKAEGFNVGVNEPYSPADGVYYTLACHAEARGLAAAMVEIRNDLIGTDAEQRVWAERLAALLAQAADIGKRRSAG